MTSPRTRWIGLFIISLAVSLIIVDSTIVNAAAFGDDAEARAMAGRASPAGAPER